MKPEMGRWVKKADGHFASAELLFGEAHYPQSIFFYEQAIECLLKAVWLDAHEEGSPPKVHDLVDLAEQLQVEFDEAQLAFLRQLQDQYMPTRYADVEVEYDAETSHLYRDSSRRMVEWLRLKLR